KYRLIQPQRFGQFGVQSTDETDQAPFPLDASGLPRMQGRMLAWHETERIGSAGIAQQSFDIGLEVVEIDILAAVGPALRQAATGDDTSQHGLLLQAFQLADKAQPALEQSHARLLTIEVVLQRLDQARPQRRAHGGHVGGDRVGQLQRLNARCKQLEQLVIDEAVGDRLLVATSYQQATQSRQFGTSFGLGLRRQAGLRVTYRQAVVAVEATQLFDQIHFQADVEAMARHTDQP